MLVFALIMLAAMPLPKSGQCPTGYRESGGYCAAESAAQENLIMLPLQLATEPTAVGCS